MKKFSLNKILKILRIILLILLILSILPRIINKASAAEAEPEPEEPLLPYTIEFPAYNFDGFDSGEENQEDLILDFDFYENLYDPESDFYKASNSFIDLTMEKTYINNFVDNAEMISTALQDGTITYDQFISYQKFYELCWIRILAQYFIFAFMFIVLFKAVRSFFF